MNGLEYIASRLDAFYEELGREHYLLGAGLKSEPQIGEIYRKYRDLYTAETIRALEEALTMADGETSRRVRYLLAFAYSNYMQSSVSTLTEAYLMKEMETVVRVNGEELPFRKAMSVIRCIGDRDKRRGLEREISQKLGEMNHILRERVMCLHDIASEFGYRSYMDLYSAVKGINYGGLMSALDGFLRRTSSLYRDLLEDMLHGIGVELEEAERHDVYYLLNSAEVGGDFSRENLMPSFTGTLKKLGIDIDTQKNVILDLEERENKSPRAFTAPIRVPEEVVLVITPRGGADDYAALLHEGGHTEHFANTSPHLPAEYRHLGDNAVTETYAFLLEYLLTNRNWLEDFVGCDDAARLFLFQKLFFVRRYSAKLKYELELHAAREIEGMEEVYKDILDGILMFSNPPEMYLYDVDDGFYTADYLRAWIFEAQLKSVMMEKYGYAWYRDAEAGKYLIGLWRYGQKYSVSELANFIGYQGLNVDDLLDELQEGLAS